MPFSVPSGIPDFREIAAPKREVDILRRALQLVQRCVPDTWSWHVQEAVRRGDVQLDALARLDAPDGTSATLVFEVKRLLTARDASGAVQLLREMIADADVPSPLPIMVARYLAPSTRERLEQEGVGYADATGNLYVALDRPALFVRNAGADHDPWRGPGRPRGTLKGAPAARVVRALVDFFPPYSVPELMERSQVSSGAAYRVMKFLEEEALVQRTPRGPITEVVWRPLLERWSQDYGFQRSDVVQSFLFPRGVETLLSALSSLANNDDYVLTGSLAAQNYAPYAPPRLAMLYVSDMPSFCERLGLRAVDKGANVMLAANSDDVSFARSQQISGVRMAAPSQIAVDLLTGPGRMPSEAQALMNWMEANEDAWRR